MPRAAFVLEIKPDRVDEYARAHAAVWPDLRGAIGAAGIRNYSIFLYKRFAFGYLESDDLEAAWAYLAAQDVNRQWQDAIAEFLDARVRDDGPTLLPEIFHFD